MKTNIDNNSPKSVAMNYPKASDFIKEHHPRYSSSVQNALANGGYETELEVSEAMWTGTYLIMDWKVLVATYLDAILSEDFEQAEKLLPILKARNITINLY